MIARGTATRGAGNSRITGTCLLLLAGTGLLYAYGLHRSPIYLSHDEVLFALNARAIALTGRDQSGALLPLFVRVRGTYWLTPFVLYYTALFLRVLPLSEFSARLPAVSIGIVNVALMYFVARRIFTRTSSAVVAAAMLALTPAHFIHSRLGVDHLYPVPFALLWMWCLATFLSTRRPIYLVWSTASLAAGMYTHLAAVVVMPLLFALTMAAVMLTNPKQLRLHALAACGFALPLLPLITWIVVHPSQYSDHVRMYGLYDASKLNPLQGARELLSYASLTARSDVYWDYFNPSFLFFSGDSSLINSTRLAGVFPMAFAVLLPVGLYAIVKRPSAMPVIVLLTMLVSPAGAVLVGEPHRINRALVMLPSAVLIAALGFDHIVSAGTKARQVLAAALIMLMAAQFGGFVRDYFGDYRIRASVWFERNIRDGVNEMITRDSQNPAPGIYLSENIQWVDAYWQFYAIERRHDASSRVHVIDSMRLDADSLEPRSLLLAAVSDSGQPLIRGGTSAYRGVTTITEPNQLPSFVLLER